MAALTFNEIAQQQFKTFVDYMCVLCKDDPSDYSIELGANTQSIRHNKKGRLVHDIRLKAFVSKLTVINIVLEKIVLSQV